MNAKSSELLKDVSNVASCSKPSFGVMTKAKAVVNMSKVPFPIKCDFLSASCEFHHIVSMDAHYGHSPPKESCKANEDAPPVPIEHEFMNDKAESSTGDEATSADDLSSSNEEDMVVS